MADQRNAAPPPTGPGSPTPSFGSPTVDSSRYVFGSVIAHGEAGEVLQATDVQLGREVAVKRLSQRASSELAMARFFREATVQGRLAHPAIVPVYELGVDHQGRPFFVMQMLEGITLDQRIAAGHPREALLRAFADVCLAVDFAHARGVIHRDLKPANVVLGEYGEVYVLDWGLARVEAEDDALDAAPREATGYAAPELLASPSTVDGRADVYALGCILFELLAGDPLAPGAAGTPAARPSARGANVPPELDVLCLAATEPKPAARIATARELGVRVQQFLDGDRDHAQRTELALVHLAAARVAFADREAESSRRRAIQEASRALALQPQLAEAADLVTRLVIEPPATMPAEVQHAIDLDNATTVRRNQRIAAWAYLGFIAVIPILTGIPLLHAAVVVGIILVNAALLVIEQSPGPRRMILIGVGNASLVAVLAWMFSPFLIAPGIAALITIAFVFTPTFEDAGAALTIALLMVLAILIPYGAERVGVLPQTMFMTSDSITFRAIGQGAVSGDAGLAGLILYVGALVSAAAGMGHAMRRSERSVRTRLHLQTWQLAQLVAPRT